MTKLDDLRSQMVEHDDEESTEKERLAYLLKVYELFKEKKEIAIESKKDAKDLMFAIHYHDPGNRHDKRKSSIVNNDYAKDMFRRCLDLLTRGKVDYSNYAIMEDIDEDHYEVAARLIMYMPSLAYEYMPKMDVWVKQMMDLNVGAAFDHCMSNAVFCYHVFNEYEDGYMPIAACFEMICNIDLELYKVLFELNGNSKVKMKTAFVVNEDITDIFMLKDYIQVFRLYVANAKEYYIAMGNDNTNNDVQAILEYYDFNLETKVMVISDFLDAVGFGDKVDAKRIEAAINISTTPYDASILIYNDIMGVSTSQSLDLPSGLID